MKRPKKGPPPKKDGKDEVPPPDSHHLRFDEDIKTYYEILEIPEGSTCEQARSSFKKLALKWHPGLQLITIPLISLDKNVGNSEAAAEMVCAFSHPHSPSR